MKVSMLCKSDRREFLKGTAWMGAVAMAAGCANNPLKIFGTAGAPMQGCALKPMKKVRVACVGDSITQGIGTPQAADSSFPESYPSQLAKILGDGYEVSNFGVGGRTLIRKADKLDYGRALKSDPSVVVICAGTNDSKPYCWDNYADDYAPDYEKMVSEFKSRPSRPPAAGPGVPCRRPPAGTSTGPCRTARPPLCRRTRHSCG